MCKNCKYYKPYDDKTGRCISMNILVFFNEPKCEEYTERKEK